MREIESAAVIPRLQDLDLVLLSNFVHQVVNPLNGVAGTLDNIVEGKIKDQSRRDQRLRAARAQVEQCISLMRNMAYFAQGFVRLLDTDTREIVLPQVVIESAMFFQEDAELRGIRIHLQDRSTQNKVAGHPELVRQILMNIFDNCVKYSRSDTEVEVNQWIQKKSGNALISIKSVPASVVFPGDLSSFFDLGFRGKNATSIVASGTGIGLYISKKIVEDVHGGHITVRFADQKKIEFLITLPRGSKTEGVGP